MLQAWIVSREESLYFAAAATPRSLASLRRHIQEMQRRRQGRLHVALRLNGSEWGPGPSRSQRFFVNSQARVSIRRSRLPSSRARLSDHPSWGLKARLAVALLGRRWGSSGHAANHIAHATRGGGAIAPRL